MSVKTLVALAASSVLSISLVYVAPVLADDATAPSMQNNPQNNGSTNPGTNTDTNNTPSSTDSSANSNDDMGSVDTGTADTAPDESDD